MSSCIKDLLIEYTNPLTVLLLCNIWWQLLLCGTHSACNKVPHNLLTPTMTTLVITTFIKSGHWFISWTCLNLHKVSSGMEAFGAPFFSWIDIIPSSRTSQNIIYFLQLWVNPSTHTLGNVVHIGAGTASESQTVQPFFNGKNISTSWTKH